MGAGCCILCELVEGEGKQKKYEDLRVWMAISDSRFNAQPPLIEAILTVVRVV